MFAIQHFQANFLYSIQKNCQWNNKLGYIWSSIFIY